MRRYQAVLILDPDLEDKALEDFCEMFHKLLKRGKATNVKELESDMRDMAHVVKKHPRTRFWRVAFDAEPGLIAKLKEEIRHDERLLRQMYLSAAPGQKEEGSSQEG
ncbi:30S ribosomal protein S6 [candidate division WOR-3 bacterium]|nr:30S ribosomal protein S6 [candidate division WOR-3 bacterium]